jgi:phosphoserine phosphatase
MNRQLLLSFQGPHHPEILSRLGALLDSWPVRLLDLHGLEQDQIFSGLWQLEWTSEQEPQLMEKSLCSLMQEFDMQFRLSQSEVQPKREQRFILTLLGEHLSTSLLAQLLQRLQQEELLVHGLQPLESQHLRVLELQLRTHQQLDRPRLLRDLLPLHQQHHVDFALQPESLFRRHKRLIVFDADMTFIQCEIINEMSQLVGCEAEVKVLTEAAMRGELDFEEALRARVRLLKGLHRDDLQSLLRQLPYTPGVRRLVRVLKQLGYKLALLSGGFQLFVDHICEEFHLDYGFANSLEWQDGRLTGELLGEIVDGQRKAQLLQEIAAREGIVPEQVVAIGDGANDVQMLAIAGLGIAFNAKPVLQERASGQLNQPNLDALLYFLGLSGQELANC